MTDTRAISLITNLFKDLINFSTLTDKRSIINSLYV